MFKSLVKISFLACFAIIFNSKLFGYNGSTSDPTIEPASPSITITSGPTANQLQIVSVDFKWKDNIGISKIVVTLYKKDSSGNYTSSIATKTINTTNSDGTSITTITPDSSQSQNTPVKVVI